MPHNQTSSLEHNPTNNEICQMMLKSGLTISLIAGILIPSLSKPVAATSTKKSEKAGDRNAASIKLSAENKSRNTLPKISNSRGRVRTLIANLSSRPSAKHSADASRSNPNVIDPTIDSQTANRTKTLAQNLVSPDSTTTLAAKPARVHIVSRGDTISKIARQYGVSKEDLVKLNQLRNSNVIFVSQRIEIPTTNTSITSVEPLQNTQQQYIRSSSFTPVKVANKPKVIGSSSKSDRFSPAIDASPKIETVSVATSRKPSNSLPIDLPEDSIALQLPPMLPSDEYLPSAFDGYIWPAQGVLTSGYGWRWGRMHRGIDIAAPIGTPIVAAAAGKVIDVGWQSGYGNLVKLEHLDGSVTIYAHNHRNLVTHGQKVSQGEQIAKMGNTGHSTGPHLHFEIRLADKAAIDPLALLGDR